MNKLCAWLDEVFWPRRLKCLCCEDRSEGRFLCPTCEKGLRAMRLSPGEVGDSQVRSVYRYEGVAKQLVLLLKDACAADAACPLAEGIAESIREWKLPQDLVLTWVTMPEQRRRKRGIDHGRTLCETVAARTGLPARQIFIRTGRFHTQRGLDRDARLKNLAGTIRCPERISGPVLLIDDVTTTGATSALCVEALLNAGASTAYVVTATRSMLKN